MGAKQAHETTVRQLAAVTFGAGGAGPHDAIPQCCEQGTVLAGAQAIGAFAAHPGSARSLGDAAVTCQYVEEAKLALRCPPVTTDARFLTVTHRPAWITNAAL